MILNNTSMIQNLYNTFMIEALVLRWQTLKWITSNLNFNFKKAESGSTGLIKMASISWWVSQSIQCRTKHCIRLASQDSILTLHIQTSSAKWNQAGASKRATAAGPAAAELTFAHCKSERGLLLNILCDQSPPVVVLAWWMRQKSALSRDGQESWAAAACRGPAPQASGLWASIAKKSLYVSLRGQQMLRFCSKGCAKEDAFLPVTQLLRKYITKTKTIWKMDLKNASFNKTVQIMW